MGIYEFRCKEHGRFEVKQSINDVHRAKCPKCGKQGERIYVPLRHVWPGSAEIKEESYD